MESKLGILWRVVVLLLLVVLDVRDLWFKSQWLGSDDSFLFTSTSVETLQASSSLRLAHPLNGTEWENVQRASGWTSFLQPCDSMEGFRGKYFLHARLRNCTVGANADTSIQVVPDLVVSSGVRADSMAWAACQLLFTHRRPPICHENIVVEFLRRYAMHFPVVPRSHMLTPMSDAEAEAFNLLDVISKSAPLSSIVCVEGFEYVSTTKESKATLFGCGSPTAFEAAFIGRHATSFGELHRQLAWLTVHDVNVLGMHYVVRQNAISSFSVIDASQDKQTMTLVHESEVNLSSSGVLYHLLISVDFILLLIHAFSAVELATLIMTRSENLKRAGSDIGKLSAGFFTMSLYRSTPVIVLTVISQLVSWILVLPISVIWSWSESVLSQFHAVLSIMRVWVLVLLALRAFWHFFVGMRESSAYTLVKRTYVASFEIMTATALAMLILRGQIHQIRDQKYSLDKQRLVDTTTFDNIAVVSNAYHDEQDYFPLSSRASVVSLLYIPLANILLLSLLFVGVTIGVRYAYFSRRLVAMEFGAMNENRPTSPLSSSAVGVYARLPAEDLLNAAIRAKQLVRSRLSVEIPSPNQKWLRAEQYLEYGVLLENGKYLRTRIGFLGVAKPKIHIDDGHAVVGGHGHLESQLGDDDDSGKHASADSPTKKRRMSAHIPSVR